MKRKGLLKKMIGALCVGIFLCMPVTANAAEKGDVVGKWTGGWANVIFDENGNAKDNWNTKPYWMESGSLTITHNDGSTETVDYDFWRGWGYEMDDLADDEYADAVLYKIIEPGKMKAWNVVHWENNGGKWEPGAGQATLTKYTGSDDSDSKDSVSSGKKCEHYYEWTVTTEPTETEDGVCSYQCIYCGGIIASQPVSADVAVRENLLTSIKNAEAGSTVTFDSEGWLCYPQYVLDELKEKGDISLKTNFTYGGINYSFTIPAGSDYTNLEQADFYGFMYLFGAFDGIIVE
ncbi:MAG: hypothetical protein K2N80_04030 [Lachnospiraceae bacterium]|nr:hypothetical protein [Lachnospiraceae bacterium]